MVDSFDTPAILMVNAPSLNGRTLIYGDNDAFDSFIIQPVYILLVKKC